MTWRATRLKHLCIDAGQYGLNIPSDEYSDTGHRLIRTSDITEFSDLADEGVHVQIPLQDRYKLEAGDLLLSRSGTLGRSLRVPDHAVGATYAGYLVRFRPRQDVDSRFLHYVACSTAFQGQVESQAVSSTIQNFNAERYANISITSPGLEEQRRISDFLDAEIARIDSLSHLRRHQLDLIALRESSMLDRVVRGATDFQVRLQRIASRVTSGPRGWGEFVSDSGSLFLRIANIPRSGINLQLDDQVYVHAPSGKERERTRTRSGDVLVSITADLGSVAIVDSSAVDANVSQHIALVRPRHDVCHPLWLAYSLKSPMVQESLTTSGYGGTKVGLSLADVSRTMIPLPDLETQRMLALQISKQLENSLRLKRNIERQIDALQERRRVIINAAVTGEIDVRAAFSSS